MKMKTYHFTASRVVVQRQEAPFTVTVPAYYKHETVEAIAEQHAQYALEPDDWRGDGSSPRAESYRITAHLDGTTESET